MSCGSFVGWLGNMASIVNPESVAAFTEASFRQSSAEAVYRTEDLDGSEGLVCRHSRSSVRFRLCVGFRMPARRRRNHVHRGRRPEASREGTRGTVGRRECRAHLWGFGRFGSGAGSAPMHPSQRSGGVDAPERGVIAVAELARRCRSMLHPQGAHPFDRAPARPAQDQPW
jgi:hypothetical protein